MKFPWTKKELKEKSDNGMIRALIVERQSTLNIYSSLHKRLAALYDKYNKLVEKELSL